CWSQRLGFPCCNGCDVVYTDNDGKWGAENGNWCGIDTSKCGNNNSNNQCFSTALGYPCCNGCEVVDITYTDNDGRWGVENGNWCGIKNYC
ncbi:Non-catalytic module family DOC2, partial [Piromyces sp. E2]